jgi:simple sugar transport system permease protein
MSRVRSLLERAAVPVLAVVSALIVGAIVIVVTDLKHLSEIGADPVAAIGGSIGGVIDGYGSMLAGAIGDPQRIWNAIQSGSQKDIATAIRPLTETLVASTPLIFAGLGVAISFRAGMFNIGGTGQMILGALAATTTAIALQNHAPSFVILVAAVIAGIVVGGLWGFIPGFLKARTGAHEVITTIMLNYVAAQITFFALEQDFIRLPGAGQPISKVTSSYVDVPNIITLPAIRLDYGFVVALVMAVVASWFLFKTTKGFELRASGFNPTAAKYAGMSAGGSMMLAMTLSGAFAGMGGALLVIGTVGQLSLDLASGIGFNAIALALLGGLRPSGVVLSALLFGALTNGGHLMGITSGIPYDLLFFLIALVIMFVAAPGLIRAMWRLRAPKQPEVAA